MTHFSTQNYIAFQTIMFFTKSKIQIGEVHIHSIKSMLGFIAPSFGFIAPSLGAMKPKLDFIVASLLETNLEAAIPYFPEQMVQVCLWCPNQWKRTASESFRNVRTTIDFGILQNFCNEISIFFCLQVDSISFGDEARVIRFFGRAKAWLFPMMAKQECSVSLVFLEVP